MTLAVVELGQIVEVIWVSLIATVALATTYSIAIFSTGRSAEARRGGHGAVAIVYGTLAVVFLAIFLGIMVLGVHTMLSKG